MKPIPLSAGMEARWACFYAGLDDARGMWRFGRFVVFLLAIGLVRLLPMRWATGLGGWLGWCAFWVLTRYRKRSIQNIGVAFPGADLCWKRTVAEASMRGLGVGFVEAIALGEMRPEERRALAEVSGAGNLAAALDKGRGAVLLSAHLGCWEFLPAYVAALGRRTAVVVEPQAAVWETELLRREREKLGVLEIRPTLSSLRTALRILSDGGVVVCPYDRDAGERGSRVTFLARSMTLPSLPLRLALAAGSSILPAYTTRGRGRHAVIFETPVEVEVREDIPGMTSGLAGLVESWIKRRPEQWTWMDVKGQEIFGNE